jgi:peroxiredoxin
VSEPRADRVKRREPRRGKRSRRPLWPWIAAGALVLLAFAYFGPFRSSDSASVDGGGHSADDPRITLIAGKTAPDFTLPAVDGSSVRLSELRAKSNVLLYFQEGIMCPPCWQQMRDLKGDADKLAALNTALVTITVDPLDQLKANVPRERVEGMTLLSDNDLKVSSLYQALYTGMMGGRTPGHSFVLIGTDGTILWRRDFKEMYVTDPTILDPVAKALGR